MELKPNDLASEWKAGKFRPVYYLFGEESAALQYLFFAEIAG